MIKEKYKTGLFILVALICIGLSIRYFMTGEFLGGGIALVVGIAIPLPLIFKKGVGKE